MITRKPYFYLFVITSYISIIYSPSSLSNNPNSLSGLKNWGKGVVTVQTTKTENAKFRVVIAKSNKERRQGLMHIESMKDNEGMILIFNQRKKHVPALPACHSSTAPADGPASALPCPSLPLPPRW